MGPKGKDTDMLLPQAMSRRQMVVGTAALLVSGPAAAQNAKIPTKGGILTPPDAHTFANANQIFLIDVRRPDEWASTGSGEGAHRLDMRRKDFVEALDTLVAGDRAAPVALICARGVRSNAMSRRLRNAGYTNIIDVPEGMLGSRAGPGWIKRKLPVIR